MKRVVFDTAFLTLSSLAQPGTARASILEAWHEGIFTVILSPSMFQEVIRTFQRPFFIDRLDREVIAQYLSAIHWRATLVPITKAVEGFAAQPENDLALATAASGNAQYVVTSDEGLLRLGWYRGVALLDAESFAALRRTPHGL